MKIYTYIIGRCPVTGVQTVERRELTSIAKKFDMRQYLADMRYRQGNPNWNQTIKLNVNQRHNALKTQ